MLRVLRCDKGGKPGLFDGVQMMYHAHTVVRPVSGVHPVELLARVLIAFETKGGGAGWRHVVDLRAFPEQVGTFLISWPAAGALAVLKMVDVSQIPAAKGAVHAARRNEVW